MTLSINVKNEGETKSLAENIAKCLQKGGLGAWIIYLKGDLGAGKTTFTRFLLQALGHVGSVKSPTYTLVEPYKLGLIDVFHFDLYRLNDPEELEFMGIRDYFRDDSLCLLEWPEKGQHLLPPADIELTIAFDGEQRTFSANAHSKKGKALVTMLK